MHPPTNVMGTISIMDSFLIELTSVNNCTEDPERCLKGHAKDMNHEGALRLRMGHRDGLRASSTAATVVSDCLDTSIDGSQKCGVACGIHTSQRTSSLWVSRRVCCILPLRDGGNHDCCASENVSEDQKIHCHCGARCTESEKPHTCSKKLFAPPEKRQSSFLKMQHHAGR